MLYSKTQKLSIDGNKTGVGGKTWNLNKCEESHKTLTPVIKTENVVPIREKQYLGGINVKAPGYNSQLRH